MILDFPDAYQDYDFDCGPAAVQAVLGYFSRPVELTELTAALQADEEKGTPPDALCAELRRHGLDVQFGQMGIAELRAAIEQGSPTILVLQAWPEKSPEAAWDDGHYVIAIGYLCDRILFEDPSEDDLIWLTERELLDRWHDRDAGGNEYHCFGIVVSEDESAQDDADA